MFDKMYQPYLLNFLMITVLVLNLGCELGGSEHENASLKSELRRPIIEQKIREIWKWGDKEHLWRSGKLRCPYLPQVSSDINEKFLRCNPLFLQCLAMQNSNNAVGNMIFFPKTKPFFIHKNGENGYHVFYYLTANRKRRFSLFLPMQCNEKKLPHRIYGMGVLDKTNDWLWDNKNYDIFFDSEYVTNFEVAMWKDIKINFFSKKLFMPATNLTFKEMKQFCKDWGKELLNARVFDAAAAFHYRQTKSGDRYDSRSLYPWKGRENDQFLHVAQYDTNFQFQKHYCKKIFTKECLSEEFGVMVSHARSVYGLNNSLGGFLEAVWNKVNPKYNLIPSSFHFSIHSQWHQIGKRVIWNGKVGDGLLINWVDQQQKLGELPALNRFPIAFRCMRSTK